MRARLSLRGGWWYYFCALCIGFYIRYDHTTKPERRQAHFGRRLTVCDKLCMHVRVSEWVSDGLVACDSPRWLRGGPFDLSAGLLLLLLPPCLSESIHRLVRVHWDPSLFSTHHGLELRVRLWRSSEEFFTSSSLQFLIGRTWGSGALMEHLCELFDSREKLKL